MTLVEDFNNYRAGMNEKILSIATLIGGTIVIPHLRRAVEYWEALQNQ